MRAQANAQGSAVEAVVRGLQALHLHACAVDLARSALTECPERDDAASLHRLAALSLDALGRSAEAAAHHAESVEAGLRGWLPARRTPERAGRSFGSIAVF